MRLSIVIPTLDRCEFLKGTLEDILRERDWLPKHLAAAVDIVVSDNASVDATHAVVQQFIGRGVTYVRHEVREDIGPSICRTIGLAKGDFVWVFGDDDLLHPGALRQVVELLQRNREVAMIYLNRLVLDVQLREVVCVAHSRWEGVEQFLSISDFIRDFSHWPGFISAMVFSRSAFEAGAAFNRREFEGWEFLAQIYVGAKNRQVCVYYVPLLSQRMGVNRWKAKWPRYWLVSMPQMLHALEVAGVTEDAVATWRRNEVTVFRTLVDSVVAKAFGATTQDPFWPEAIRWQIGAKRAVMIVVRWCLPVSLAKTVYRLQPKYRA
jgi:glycosyltransferase involved in cell wall biosynthesis